MLSDVKLTEELEYKDMSVNWTGNSCDSLNKSSSRPRKDSEKRRKSDWRCWQAFDMNQQGEKFKI